MGVVWNGLGLTIVALGLLEMGFAGLIYATRPDRFQNRILALSIYALGLFQSVFFGIRVMWDNPIQARAAAIASFPILAVFVVAYPIFLSTLETPLTRPFRHPVGRAVLIAFGAVLIATLAIEPELYFTTARPFQYVGGYDYESGPLRAPVLRILQLLFLYGLIVALHAWRRAHSPFLRRQMGVYAIAFAGHDGIITLWLAHRNLGQPFTGPHADELLLIIASPIQTLWLVSWLTYGILRTHLFDIDLKIKFALRQSTLLAFFAGVFFVASESLEELVPVEGFYLGLAAAALIALGLRPLQRISARLADQLMPNVKDTAAYRRERKEEVYRAALEGGLEAGTVSARERRILEALRRKLEIEPAEAARIEQRVHATPAPPA